MSDPTTLEGWRDRALAAEAERERLAIETARLGTESFARERKLAKLEAEVERMRANVEHDLRLAANNAAACEHARFMAGGWRRAVWVYRELWSDVEEIRLHEFDEMEVERNRMRAVVEAARAYRPLMAHICGNSPYYGAALDAAEALAVAVDALDKGGA